MTFKELRKTKFRTAREFAAALGVNTPRVQKWDGGANIPTSYLRPVAKLLGVSVNALLDCIERGRK